MSHPLAAPATPLNQPKHLTRHKAGGAQKPLPQHGTRAAAPVQRLFSLTVSEWNHSGDAYEAGKRRKG